MKRNIDTQILLKILTWEDSFSLHTVSNNRKREERKSGREKEIEKGIFFLPHLVAPIKRGKIKVNRGFHHKTFKGGIYFDTFLLLHRTQNANSISLVNQ